GFDTGRQGGPSRCGICITRNAAWSHGGWEPGSRSVLRRVVSVTRTRCAFSDREQCFGPNRDARAQLRKVRPAPKSSKTGRIIVFGEVPRTREESESFTGRYLICTRRAGIIGSCREQGKNCHSRPAINCVGVRAAELERSGNPTYTR